MTLWLEIYGGVKKQCWSYLLLLACRHTDGFRLIYLLIFSVGKTMIALFCKKRERERQTVRDLNQQNLIHLWVCTRCNSCFKTDLSIIFYLVVSFSRICSQFTKVNPTHSSVVTKYSGLVKCLSVSLLGPVGAMSSSYHFQSARVIGFNRLSGKWRVPRTVNLRQLLMAAD